MRHDKSSKLASDPSDTGILTITSDMDDDGKDNDYIGESDNESSSIDGDISLVDESAMELEIKASRLKM